MRDEESARCDACRVTQLPVLPALYEVKAPEWKGPLRFCAHHMRQVADALPATGYEVAEVAL